MQENFKVRGKKLYFGFVHLIKAFHREVIRQAVRKLGVGRTASISRCKNSCKSSLW